ncbi:MAG: RNA methyltransferase [Anaerolineaceae bacterium]|nr:RNA methyltransferase [Anaerolineaceae bacterium]
MRCGAAVSSNSTSIFANTFSNGINPLLIDVGNEISGIDPAILDQSDSIVYIPMLGSKDSLNVAIAAAISFYMYRFSLVEEN